MAYFLLDKFLIKLYGNKGIAEKGEIFSPFLFAIGLLTQYNCDTNTLASYGPKSVMIPSSPASTS